MDSALALFFGNFLTVEIIQFPFSYILGKVDKEYDKKTVPKLCTVMYLLKLLFLITQQGMATLVLCPY